MTEFNALRQTAKELGINPFGKTAEALQTAIDEARAAPAAASSEPDEPKKAPIETASKKTAGTRRDLSESSVSARQRAEEIRKARRDRGYNLNALDYRLAVNNKEDGYEYRWVNDTHGRIQRLESRGWERAPNEEPRLVDKKTGLKAYLLRIPQEIYDEDFLAKQAPIDAVEKEILEGTIKDGPNVESNRRAGKATITHRRKNA